LVDEDFVNYKKPSMFIGTPQCDYKCVRELGLPIEICQNSALAQMTTIKYDIAKLCERYLSNPITSAIVFGGMEPFMRFAEVLAFVKMMRNRYNCADDIVIYTGYNPDEIASNLYALAGFDNITIKFGRYIPDRATVHDDVLGVTLASNNQFAVVLTYDIVDFLTDM
jgi:organic radical activating enzyme